MLTFHCESSFFYFPSHTGLTCAGLHLVRYKLVIFAKRKRTEILFLSRHDGEFLGEGGKLIDVRAVSECSEYMDFTARGHFDSKTPVLVRCDIFQVGAEMFDR